MRGRHCLRRSPARGRRCRDLAYAYQTAAGIHIGPGAGRPRRADGAAAEAREALARKTRDILGAVQRACALYCQRWVRRRQNQKNKLGKIWKLTVNFKVLIQIFSQPNK